MDGFGQPTENAVPWKKIAIIGGAALGVILIIVVVVLVVRARNAAEIDQTKLDRTTDQVNSAIANCENAADPQACRASAIEEAAITVGDSDVCGMLEGEERDSCLWVLARDKQDASVCKEIENEADRASCNDEVTMKAALYAGNADACNGISDADAKENCRSTILQQQAHAGSCDSQELGVPYCNGIPLMESAVAARNPAGCDPIVDEELKADCKDIIGPGDVDRDDLNATLEARYGTSDTNPDSDGDGLTDFAEVNEWGTDPVNFDTDGDSFSDGQEVAGGYNPLGAGTL